MIVAADIYLICKKNNKTKQKLNHTNILLEANATVQGQCLTKISSYMTAECDLLYI
jgi:hypothetical protein